MSAHGRKMIAPIVITALLLIYLAAYFGLIVYVIEGWPRLLLCVVPVALAVGLVATLIRRIKEIRSGEEDDLGQY